MHCIGGEIPNYVSVLADPPASSDTIICVAGFHTIHDHHPLQMGWESASSSELWIDLKSLPLGTRIAMAVVEIRNDHVFWTWTFY